MNNRTKELANLTAQQKRALLAKLLQEKAIEKHPLSYGQKALWFLHQSHPESAAYNVAGAARIRSALDLPQLSGAFQALIDRQAALRTTFSMQEGLPVQEVHDYQKLYFEQIDASGWSWEELNKQVARAYARPFSLSKGPLLRVTLFTRSSDDHILLLTLHHIICDGWSVWMMFDDLQFLLGQGYTQKATSEKLPPLKSQYTDYVQWQAQMLQEEGEKLQHYWQQQLKAPLPFLNLPTDYPRPALQSHKGASYTAKLPDLLGQLLRETARHFGVTPYMLFLATFQILLHRYTGQDDILVGSPTAGRNQNQFANVVGYFVNPIVLRADLSGNPTFAAFLGQVRRTVLDAMAHQEYPFALLVEQLQPKREPSRSPIFQVLFTLEKAQQASQMMPLLTAQAGTHIKLKGLQIEPYQIAQQEGQFDLTLNVVEAQHTFTLLYSYNTDLFQSSTIQRMAEHFQSLLAGACKTALSRGTRDHSLSELPLLTQAERHQLLVTSNNTQKDYPLHLPIHQLFEQQVERTPDAIAVVLPPQGWGGLRGGGASLTYRQLNSRANQLAHHLQKLAVGPETLVGICIERSLEMVIGLLAVLKAGGAYLPLDPGYPKERLAFMIEDAQIPVLLTQQSLIRELSLPKAYASDMPHLLSLDSQSHLLSEESQENPKSGVTPENLAYVIYTSGSTGKPKGVMIEHRAICNQMHWVQETFKLTPQDKLLQKTPFSFDASVKEFFMPLLVGAQLVMAKAGGHQQPDYLVKLMIEQQITILQLVPSLLRMLVDQPGFQNCTHLRYIFCAGEALPVALQHRCLAIHPILHNLYGPTEAAIDVTHWPPPSEGPAKPPSEGPSQPPSLNPSQLWEGSLAPPSLNPSQLWEGSLARLAPSGGKEKNSHSISDVAQKQSPNPALTPNPSPNSGRGGLNPATVPIGRAIANIQLYILDPHLQAVPIGVAGELHIGGTGLARGYLNRPELTKERFIEWRGQRLYKTGDLVRYLPPPALPQSLPTLGGKFRGRIREQDNRACPLAIEFLGRLDHQVKIRGYRIELGEIEALLNQHPAVQQAVVTASPLDMPQEVAQPSGLDKRLVAYIVPRPLAVGQGQAIAQPQGGETSLPKLGGTEGGRIAQPQGGETSLPKLGGTEGGRIAPPQGGETSLPKLGGTEGGRIAQPQGGETSLPKLGGTEGGRIAPPQALAPPQGTASPLGQPQLRRYLAQTLPHYMIPATFVMLDELPLTPNGKINRRALPPPNVGGGRGAAELPSQSWEGLREGGGARSLLSSFVPPRDLYELQLAQLWQEVLDLHPVGVQDNFFELGGHSLLAVRLMAKIEQQFGQKLPLATLFQEATIEQLAQRLRRQQPEASTPLVAIQPDGSKPPFFCIHPIGGHVLCYIELARHLGTEQPFYGLQATPDARGARTEGQPLVLAPISIEKMAAHYIAALQTIQAEGPYYLGGWSFGGLVAFEMAAQLQKQGQEVKLLALLDSQAPPFDLQPGLLDDQAKLLSFLAHHLQGTIGRDPSVPSGACPEERGVGTSLGQRAAISYQELQALKPEQQLSYALQQAQQLNLLPPELTPSHLQQLLGIFKSNLQAALIYEPQHFVPQHKPYPGDITLFTARQQPKLAEELLEEPIINWGKLKEQALDPTQGWHKLTTGHIEVHQIEGDHYTIMKEPHVQQLAQQIKGYLAPNPISARGVKTLG